MYDGNYPLGCSTGTTAVHGGAGLPPRPRSASEPRRMDCHELGPRYTWQEAVAARLTRAQLRDDGIRITRGAYVSRAVPLTLRSACLSVAPVLPEAATFSHLTAAALLEAPVRVAWAADRRRAAGRVPAPAQAGPGACPGSPPRGRRADPGATGHQRSTDLARSGRGPSPG